MKNTNTVSVWPKQCVHFVWSKRNIENTNINTNTNTYVNTTDQNLTAVRTALWPGGVGARSRFEGKGYARDETGTNNTNTNTNKIQIQIQIQIQEITHGLKRAPTIQT